MYTNIVHIQVYNIVCEVVPNVSARGVPVATGAVTSKTTEWKCKQDSQIACNHSVTAYATCKTRSWGRKAGKSLESPLNLFELKSYNHCHENAETMAQERCMVSLNH